MPNSPYTTPEMPSPDHMGHAKFQSHGSSQWINY